jgi:ADP-ribose pyrophosphatase
LPNRVHREPQDPLALDRGRGRHGSWIRFLGGCVTLSPTPGPVYADITCPTRGTEVVIDERDPWRRVSRRTAYANEWIEVFDDEVIRPDGRRGTYGVVHPRPEAVSILPVRGEDVLLVGQFRYPLQAYSWEIPGGGASPDEDPLEAARRELAEETGYRAAAVRELARFSVWNAVSDARCLVFLAMDLTEGPSSPEGTEQLEVRWVTRVHAMEMIRSGEIHDAITQIALSRFTLELLDEPEPPRTP